MPGQLQRMAKYAKDISEHLPSAAMLFSIDTHDFKNHTDLVRQALPQANLHTYDWRAVQKSFRLMPPEANAFEWHAEPVILAVEYWRNKSKSIPDYVWVLEDDILMCGNLSTFIASHHNDTSDFLYPLLG